MSAITTTTQIAAPVNVVLQKELLVNAKARCQYFVGSQAAEIAEHSGSFTAKWRRYENLATATTALSALTGNLALPTGRTAAQISVTDYTKAVSKYGNYVILNEEVDLVNVSDQAMKIAEIMGINSGESLNELQRNELEDNATQVYNNGTADNQVNTAITSAKIKAVVNTLQRNKARHFTAQSNGSTNIGSSPIRNAYWGICHYDVEEDIRGLTGFIAAESYGSHTALEDGEFGMINGVRFLSSSEGSIDADAGATKGSTRSTTGTVSDLYSVVIMGQDAVGSLGLSSKHVKKQYMSGDKVPAVMMINKPRGSAGAGDPFNEIATVAWKSWHGAKILNPDWIRTIRCAATDLG